jgi:hypothetical protein
MKFLDRAAVVDRCSSVPMKVMGFVPLLVCEQTLLNPGAYRIAKAAAFLGLDTTALCLTFDRLQSCQPSISLAEN